MKLFYKNIQNIVLQKKFFPLMKIILSTLLLPLFHLLLISVVILIDINLLVFPFAYLLSVLFEEYFHTIAIFSLYPNEEVYFYKNYITIYKHPVVTIAFGIKNSSSIPALSQIYVSLFGPFNALLFNLLISPVLLFISEKIFLSFLLIGILIPMLSLFPKKYPLISDGYRIIELAQAEKIKFGRTFWENFFLIEKKIFKNIIGN